MAVQTKNFVSIVAGMINQMRAAQNQITDFTVGAPERVLLESAAIEIDEAYQNLLLSVVDAIPASVYLAFNFNLLAAVYASGIVTLSVASPAVVAILIPAGSQVSTVDGSVTFTTLADATIAIGQTTVTASVRCSVAGVVGNIPAGSLTVLLTPIGGVSVTNNAGFLNGADAETDAGRQQRFQQYISTLSRGPIDSIGYAASQAAITDGAGVIIERVTSHTEVELYTLSPSYPLGYVSIYIYNGASGASAELIAAAQQAINGYVSGPTRVMGYKAAGIVATVYAATLSTVNPTLTLATADGTLTTDQINSLNQELSAYVNGLAPGEKLGFSQLIAAALRVDGIIRVESVTPGTDVAFSIGVQPVFGTAVYIPVVA